MLKFIKQDKRNILFVLWVTFFVPVFFLQAKNIDFDKIIFLISISFVFSILIYLISILISGIYKRIYFVFIFLIFLLPGVIILSTIEIDKSLLKGTDFWFIFQSNPKESGEFVFTYITWKISLIILIYTFVSVYLIQKKTLTVSLRNREKGVLLLTFILLSGFSYTNRASIFVIDFYMADPIICMIRNRLYPKNKRVRPEKR